MGIALEEEVEPVRDLIYAHICLQPEEWWKDRIYNAGFRGMKTSNQGHHLSVWGFIN